MKRKRLAAMFLAGLMALSLAGCGNSAGGGADSKDSSKSEGSSTSEGSAAQESSAKSESGETAKADSDFPNSTVTIIMPWSLGGGPDTIARQVAAYGEKYLGEPVIVENHTGGAGTIAMATALEAADDGYSMLVANGPLFSLTPSFQNVNYTLDDITPLIGMRITEFVVLTSAESGITTLEELKAYADEGHTIKYATTGGPGNDSYTMMAVLFKMLDIPAEAIPYDGGQDAINALVGGHVDVSIGSPPVYRDYVASGELNCLGTFIPEGIDVDGIGHIDSFKDQGVDVEFTGMDYFAVRSSVPDEAKKVLTEYIQEVYADEEFQSFMSEMGMEAWDATEDEIIKMIEEQTESMKEYIAMLK